MTVRKSYRIDDATVTKLNFLIKELKIDTETQLIKDAIDHLYKSYWVAKLAAKDSITFADFCRMSQIGLEYVE